MYVNYQAFICKDDINTSLILIYPEYKEKEENKMCIDKVIIKW